MILAELKLARRAHHSAALDSPDRRHLERHVAARNVGARRAEHAEHPGARIGRPAHHLDLLAGAGIDRQHLKLVRLRVLLGGQDPGHRERRQRLGRVADILDLEADGGELVGNLLRRGIGVEVVLEPRKREFHAPTPPDSVGTSRARKP